MKKCKMFLWFAGALSLASCSSGHSYEDARCFDWADFAEVKDLHGTTLDFDSMVMRPVDIQVYDSLMVVVEYNNDKLLGLFNLNTQKKIGDRINLGQGPKDMIQPRIMNGDGQSIRIFDMATSTFYQYDISSFVEKEEPDAMQKVKTEVPVFVNMELVNDNLMGYSYNINHQLYVFDRITGMKTREMVDYPVSDISYTDAEKQDAFYMNFVTNGTSKFAICYCMTDLIEFYDLNGKLQNRLHGPDGFFAYFKEYHDGDVVSSSPDKERTRDAYFSPRFVGERLFVLYDGGYVNEPGHNGGCRYLMSFSWDGIPDILYKLDDPIFSFAVNPLKRKIYGISNAPEYHIVEYSY